MQYVVCRIIELYFILPSSIFSNIDKIVTKYVVFSYNTEHAYCSVHSLYSPEPKFREGLHYMSWAVKSSLNTSLQISVRKINHVDCHISLTKTGFHASSRRSPLCEFGLCFQYILNSHLPPRPPPPPCLIIIKIPAGRIWRVVAPILRHVPYRLKCQGCRY